MCLHLCFVGLDAWKALPTLSYLVAYSLLTLQDPAPCHLLQAAFLEPSE